jgi:hypothetical protein
VSIRVLERELHRFRDAVRDGDYVITLHGLDEMEEDRFTILDLESGVLSGFIVERQRDRQTGESKFVIEGKTSDGRGIAIVAKRSPSGNMAVLTVYRI